MSHLQFLMRIEIRARTTYAYHWHYDMFSFLNIFLFLKLEDKNLFEMLSVLNYKWHNIFFLYSGLKSDHIKHTGSRSDYY